MKVKLKHIGVMQLSAWHGLYGLIFGAFLGVYYLAYYLFSLGYVPSRIAVYFAVLPAVTSLFGFSAYGITALVYNAAARKGGGITFELISAETADPPAPPSFGDSVLRLD